MVNQNREYKIYQKEDKVYDIIIGFKELTAKVYRLKNRKYIKICDAYKKYIDLYFKEYTFILNFSKIF